MSLKQDLDELSQLRQSIEKLPLHEAAMLNPAVALGALFSKLPTRAPKTVSPALALRFNSEMDASKKCIDNWGGNIHLDILARRNTGFLNWNEILTASGPLPKFDMRVKAMRLLADEVERQTDKAVFRSNSDYFDRPGYDLVTLEVTLPRPKPSGEVSEEIIRAVETGELDIPWDFRTDSKAFIKERVSEIVHSYYTRWTEVTTEVNQAERRGMEAEVEAEHDLKRFKPKTITALHSLAWQQGHAHGLEEVRLQYSDLVELLESTLD